MKTAPNIDRLKNILNYDPDSGIFTWKVKTCRKVTIGKEAGAISKANPLAAPYLVLNFDGTRYKLHILAYFYMTGKWLPGNIDHEDGNTLNNKFLNFRIATRKEQNTNKAKHRDGVCKYKGIHFNKRTNRYVAEIMNNRVKYHLGSFDTQEEAAKAYEIKSKELHKEFATTRKVNY